MLVTFLTLCLSAAPFNARIAPDANFAIHLPQASAAVKVRPFLERAGNHSALLRPEAWRDDTHPLLGIDVTRLETMEAAGIDVQGPLTYSTKGNWAFTCLKVKSASSYDKTAATRLATLGTPFRKTQGKATVVGAKDTLGRVLAGYVTVGTLSCAVSSPEGDGEAALTEMTKWVSAPPWNKWKPTAALNGDIFLLAPTSAVGMSATPTTATFDAVSNEGGVPALSIEKPSPYTLEGTDGLLKLRAQYAPAGLGTLVESARRALSRVCPRCERAELATATAGLEKQLTGNVLVFISEVKVQGSLKNEANRFAALKSAVLVELSSADAAEAALEPCQRYLASGKAGLTVSAQGAHLVIANDEATAKSATAFIAKSPVRLKHGMDFSFSAALAARGLSQIPLFEALSSPDLAGLLAASVEAGPLLLHTASVDGWLDGGGKAPVRAGLGWTLAGAPSRESK